MAVNLGLSEVKDTAVQGADYGSSWIKEPSVVLMQGHADLSGMLILGPDQDLPNCSLLLPCMLTPPASRQSVQFSLLQKKLSSFCFFFLLFFHFSERELGVTVIYGALWPVPVGALSTIVSTFWFSIPTLLSERK